MKKKSIFIVSLVVISLASLVWYGCTKDSDEDLMGTIYGTVTDYATGQAIGNVNVTLRPSGETTLTGNDGTFEFNDLKANKYSLSFSKAEYADLDDDYIIELEAGKKVKRDVQMRKQIASLQITDMAGNSITSLDFGLEESVTSKSFNIFNNGTLKINCQLSYNCQWIQDVVAAATEIEPGQTLTVTVVIDRTKLLSGENRTFLHIISNNGSNELEITATGYSAPTVITSNVSNITATSASCGGNVTADGGTAVTERGLCWSTANAPTVESGSHISNGTGTGPFTAMMSGLTLNTVYYVRAYATNARGTSYGEQKQFTTANGLPTVTVSNITNVTATSAVCGGSISDNGGFAVTDKGLVWSTAQYPTLSDNHISLGSGDTPFTGSMTELTIGTTYYVRAYATNANGTSFSNQRSFTTGNGLPTVTTTAPTLTDSTVATGGNVISDGGFPVTARGICYGPLPNPDLTATYNHTSNGSGTGYYSSSFSLPGGSGTYYIRAYATNEIGTVYGEQVTITHPYDYLPTFTFDGHTYRVAPVANNTMNWPDANSYCSNYTLYGYSDWRLPTKAELLQMYNDRYSIGGFGTGVYWSKTQSGYANVYYYVDFSNGHTDFHATWNQGSHNVRPIRLEN